MNVEVDETLPNSRGNKLGTRFLNLENTITVGYINKGFFITPQGLIYDTLFWPGDLVEIIKPGVGGFGDTYTVEDILPNSKSYNGSTRDDLYKYEKSYYKHNGSDNNRTFQSTYITKGLVKLKNKSNALHPQSLKLISQNGANQMALAIEQNKPTFVREFTETLEGENVVRNYIGTQTEFKTLSAAKTFTSTQISDSIRATNTYRKFAIFQEVHVAQAKQPEVEFV